MFFMLTFFVSRCVAMATDSIMWLDVSIGWLGYAIMIYTLRTCEVTMMSKRAGYVMRSKQQAANLLHMLLREPRTTTATPCSWSMCACIACVSLAVTEHYS